MNCNGWHLTDDAGNLSEWTFPATNLPASGYLVVFASGKNRVVAERPLHTNFQMANNGGYLALIQPDGTTIASVYDDYPPQRSNVSYGINGAAARRYFSPPTPGTVNAPGYPDLVADVQFSVARGFYDTPFTVSLSTTTAGAAIYWTTKGAIPTPTSGTLYTVPIAIQGNTFLRAAGNLSNYVVGVPITQTYLFMNQMIHQPDANGLPNYPIVWQASYPADYEMDSNVVNSANYGATISNDLRSIPTLSIVSTHSNFWDSANGIYVNSTSTGDNWEGPVTPDIAGFSLVPVNPGTSPAPDKGAAWRASTNPGGSPNADDPAPATPGILINEILTHTEPPQKDSVELFNPTPTSANVGGWYLSDDADTAKKNPHPG